MFGFIGAALFGIIYAGAQISDSNASKRAREKARQAGDKGYFDVNGVRRHTATGKKYTMEEIHREMFPETLEEAWARIDKENHDRFDYKYYGVENPEKINGHFVSEIFLTEEEAKAYLESVKDKLHSGKYIFKTSKWMIKKMGDEYHCNF